MRYKIVLIILALLIFGGINNLRELNDLAIVTAIGIDKSENGRYKITAQITNTNASGDSKGSSSGGESEVVVYESSEQTVQLAVRNMILESPKRLYLAHMELLILSEKIAREEFMSAIDFFIRDNEGSISFMMVVARDTTPDKILNTSTPLETNPTKNIRESINAVYKYKGTTTNRVLDEDLAELLTEGEEITVSSVRLEKNGQSEDSSEEQKSENSGKEDKEKSSQMKSKEKLIVSDMAYFKNHEMKGYLEETDNIAYNIMKNELNEYIIEANTDENNKLVAEIVKTQTKRKPKYENGKYIVDVDIKCRANITEIGPEVKLETSEELQKAQQLVEESIKKILEKYIYNCQNVYKTDLIGYGCLFNKRLNKEYKKIRENFMDQYFPNIVTNINISVEFPNEGGIVKKW